MGTWYLDIKEESRKKRDGQSTSERNGLHSIGMRGHTGKASDGGKNSSSRNPGYRKENTVSGHKKGKKKG